MTAHAQAFKTSAWARFAVYLGLVIAMVVPAQTVEIIPEFLYDAPEQMQDLLARLWPIAFYH